MLGMVGLVALLCLSPVQKHPAFTFDGAEYYFRWEKGNTREFTPKGQQDLDAWTDMVTVNDYPDVTDGEGLAARANTVLTVYQEHGGVVVRTSSIPRTDERPAEHLIVILFDREKFSEVAFARFLLRDKRAVSIVSSRRSYGASSADSIRAWVKKSAPSREKALMAFESLPVKTASAGNLGVSSTHRYAGPAR